VDLDAPLVNTDSKRQIEKVFAALADKDRRILQAVYLDELDKAEVCRRFQVEADYLRVLIHRAKAQFRKVYRGGDASPSINRAEA